jgi:OPA family glycerol-3-phosphate transporter-like MFS transporter
MRDQLGFSKTELGLVSSFFFISYGVGQLVHGILSRKYNTRYSVTVALLGSAAVNVLMTFCTDAVTMKFVWLFNGVFQSILWSSVIKTLSKRLPDEKLSRAVVIISTPPALGTFLIYGLSALLSQKAVSYKFIFLIPALLLVIIGGIWFAGLGKSTLIYEKNSKSEDKKQSRKIKFTPVFVIGAILVLFTAVANGFIKDGVTTWMPSILKESYGLKESLSILATVVLPLIAVSGAVLSTAIHKRLKNTSALNGIFYFAEAVALALVILTSNSSFLKSPVLLISLFGISAMLMSAVNNVITSIIPLYMRDKMDSGLLAGVFDTFCYVGSTLSTALLGFIADRSNWSGVFICIFIFGAAACVFCWISVFVSKKSVNNYQE